jgi:hypothetical protein
MRKPSVVIVSAADAPYYCLLADAVASVRDKAESAGVAYAVLDLGLTEYQRAELARRDVNFVKPGWDYPQARSQPEWFKAMTARTYLPKWVPGFDIYVWLDADTWVQRWESIELLCKGAEKYGFAVVAEADRAYTDIEAVTKDRGEIISFQERERKLRVYFGDKATKLRRFPTLNCGVFAASARCPIWDAWPKLMDVALTNNPRDVFFAEQTAMNVALLSGAVRYARLPAKHNWLLSSAIPRVGPNDEIVHPDFPHEPLGIIHRTAHTKRSTFCLIDIDGRQTKVGLGYSKTLVAAEQKMSA